MLLCAWVKSTVLDDGGHLCLRHCDAPNNCAVEAAQIGL